MKGANNTPRARRSLPSAGYLAKLPPIHWEAREGVPKSTVSTCHFRYRLRTGSARDTFSQPVHHWSIGASSNEGAEEVQKHDLFRTGGRVLKASIGQGNFGFSGVGGPVVRDMASEPACLSRRASLGAGHAGAATHATDSRPVAAVGSADCAVSRFPCGADPGGVHVSRASRRGRQMGASAP